MITNAIIVGDALEVLRAMPSNSVHAWITSPPYLWLRDYGTATWQGGDPACEHRSPTMREGRNEDRPVLHGSPATNNQQLRLMAQKGVCGKCGARREDKQIGLEGTVDEYLEAMTRVMREARRVLRDDGLLFLNCGDSYAGSGRGPTGKNGIGDQEKRQGFTGSVYGRVLKEGEPWREQHAVPAGMKPKDLMGIPWALAFALRADGWWLRADIIWDKPNPMPTSIKDRPNQSHEYVFMFSKSRHYYYDWWGVREREREQRQLLLWDGEAARNAKSASRNRRSVWRISPRHYKGAGEHFATFPPELVIPCVQAATSDRGACGKCMAPYQRILRPTPEYAAHLDKDWCGPDTYELDQQQGRGRFEMPDGTMSKTRRTKRKAPSVNADYDCLGWEPTCECFGHFERVEVRERQNKRKWIQDAVTPPPVSCVVGDMFFGAGTTGLTASRMGRAFTGSELSDKYARMAYTRIMQDEAAKAKPVLLTLEEFAATQSVETTA